MSENARTGHSYATGRAYLVILFDIASELHVGRAGYGLAGGRGSRI